LRSLHIAKRLAQWIDRNSLEGFLMASRNLTRPSDPSTGNAPTPFALKETLSATADVHALLLLSAPAIESEGRQKITFK
jgi:hypothetical protein